jgi:hypothetical protein
LGNLFQIDDFLIYWVLNYFEGIKKSSMLRKFPNLPFSKFKIDHYQLIHNFFILVIVHTLSKICAMRNVVIIFLITGFALTVQGQKTISTLSLQLSFPQEEYKSTYPKTGVGLRWNILHRFNEHGPLSIGGEIGYLATGSESRSFDVFYLGFYDRYRISATNNVITLAFKARADLIPWGKPVQLFIDGTVGTNLFFSSVDVERETFFGGSEYGGGNSTKGYWAFIFGPGLGVEIPLGKRKEIALSLKGSYLFGSNTKYLTDPYIDNNGNVYFTQRESKTNMILAEAGVRFGIFNHR